MKNAGFLLIEVAIVLMLIVLCTALALPHFSWLKRHMAQCEIKKLIAECFYHRSCAMALHKELSIHFDCSHNCYSTSAHKNVFLQALRIECLPGLKGPPSQPRKVIDKPITFARDTITFYPDGSMNSGTIYFVDNQAMNCFALTSATGQEPFLRCYEYVSSWVPVS